MMLATLDLLLRLCLIAILHTACAMFRDQGEIILRPTHDCLVAVFQGNLRGLLALVEQTPILKSLAARARFAPATFG